VSALNSAKALVETCSLDASGKLSSSRSGEFHRNFCRRKSSCGTVHVSSSLSDAPSPTARPASRTRSPLVRRPLLKLRRRPQGRRAREAMDLLEAKNLPLETPLVLMSASGVVLHLLKDEPPFVELQRRDDWVVIRSAVRKDVFVGPATRAHCTFGPSEAALRFKTKRSPAGRLVFLVSPSCRAFEVCVGGTLGCYDTFGMEQQSWLLYELQQRPTSFELLSVAATNENESAGRRQLIMQLLESGKSNDDVREILKLLYGSTAPIGSRAQTTNHALNTERRLQILKLLDIRVQRVGEIEALLYGPSARTSSAEVAEFEATAS
jgi:hypothetical protein